MAEAHDLLMSDSCMSDATELFRLEQENFRLGDRLAVLEAGESGGAGEGAGSGAETEEASGLRSRVDRNTSRAEELRGTLRRALGEDGVAISEDTLVSLLSALSGYEVLESWVVLKNAAVFAGELAKSLSDGQSRAGTGAEGGPAAGTEDGAGEGRKCLQVMGLAFTVCDFQLSRSSSKIGQGCLPRLDAVVDATRTAVPASGKGASLGRAAGEVVTEAARAYALKMDTHLRMIVNCRAETKAAGSKVTAAFQGKGQQRDPVKVLENAARSIRRVLARSLELVRCKGTGSGGGVMSGVYLAVSKLIMAMGDLDQVDKGLN
jgi:hypothetical protein